jgi:predicted amidophosphoribosyltransferase
MHCRYCQEAILSDWHFCRCCGAALAFTKAAPIIANKGFLDASLSLFVAGGQAQQAAHQRQAQGGYDSELLKAKLMGMASEAGIDIDL